VQQKVFSVLSSKNNFTVRKFAMHVDIHLMTHYAHSVIHRTEGEFSLTSLVFRAVNGEEITDCSSFFRRNIAVLYSSFGADVLYLFKEKRTHFGIHAAFHPLGTQWNAIN
jgi:hypothetical protein